MICTVSEQCWTDTQVEQVFRARWQSEVVFKRMKQVVRLNQLRGRSMQTNEASLLVLLLAWVMQEQEAQACRDVLDTLLQAEPEQVESAEAAKTVAEPSEWVLAVIELQTARTAVLGYWTCERVRQCLSCLQRFLCGSPRRRRTQWHTLRRWLGTHLDPSPSGPPVFSWSTG